MGFGLKMTGHPKAEIEAKVAEASRVLKLDEYLDRKPKALSGGQRQRVAIGRAIVRGPDVFLFDEPLSNLDAELRVEMRVEIARLHNEIGATMIYVTHDQVEAMTLADKIVVLRAGRIEQVGKPLDLYNDPDNRFVAGFIGSPAMNFFDGTDRGRRSPSRRLAARRSPAPASASDGRDHRGVSDPTSSGSPGRQPRSRSVRAAGRCELSLPQRTGRRADHRGGP
jgi:lactose/L-arabinose transport system ATP-binding protein